MGKDQRMSLGSLYNHQRCLPQGQSGCSQMDHPAGVPLVMKCSMETGQAAAANSLEALQWVMEQGFAWDETTCKQAASSGWLHILKWARANGCLWNFETCDAAPVQVIWMC